MLRAIKESKYLKLNYAMVKEPFVANWVLVALLTGYQFLSFTARLLFPLFALCIVVICGSVMGKKLFWTSLYGETALLYNMLPVSPREIVMTKVGLMTLATFIPSCLVEIGYYASITITKEPDEPFVMLFDDLFYVPDSMGGIWVAGLFVLLLIYQFTCWSLIFLCSTWYSTLTSEGRVWMRKVFSLATVLLVMIFFAESKEWIYIPGIYEIPWWINLLLGSVSLVLGVLFCKKAVKLLKSRDCLK